MVYLSPKNPVVFRYPIPAILWDIPVHLFFLVFFRFSFGYFSPVFIFFASSFLFTFLFVC